MLRGIVIGEVWATKKLPLLKERKLHLVAILKKDGECYKPSGKVVVAADRLGAKIGHNVIVSFGSGGRNVFIKGKENRSILIDAAISQIIDEVRE